MVTLATILIVLVVLGIGAAIVAGEWHSDPESIEEEEERERVEEGKPPAA